MAVVQGTQTSVNIVTTAISHITSYLPVSYLSDALKQYGQGILVGQGRAALKNDRQLLKST